MSKKLILLLCGVGLIFLTGRQLFVLSSTTHTERTLNELEKIEETYDKIGADTSLSNVDRGYKIVGCTDQFKEWIEKYCSKIAEELDDEGKVNMLSSQKKWEEFIVENNKLNENVVIAQYEAGSIAPIVMASLEYEAYKARAYELKEKCKRLNIIINN